MKALYQNEPARYEAVGNGSYLYRFEVHQVTTVNQDQTETTQWECQEVTVWPDASQPTHDKIVERVIADQWGAGLEQKYINDYYAAVEGILPLSAKNNYINFLTDRKVLKDEIKAICAELGIL